MGFSRIGDQPKSPALAGRFFTTEPPGKLHLILLIKVQVTHHVARLCCTFSHSSPLRPPQDTECSSLLGAEACHLPTLHNTLCLLSPRPQPPAPLATAHLRVCFCLGFLLFCSGDTSSSGLSRVTAPSGRAHQAKLGQESFIHAHSGCAHFSSGFSAPHMESLPLSPLLPAHAALKPFCKIPLSATVLFCFKTVSLSRITFS